VTISSEELIVGTWKSCKDDVFIRFIKDGGMYFKIPLASGGCEISAKYELIDGNLLKIELDQQYGAISGEPLFKNPQVLRVTVREDSIIFHNLRINESDEQVFTRIK
jgi:hypothetical protein